MNNYISTAPLYDSDYLAHYGIKGQKWGIRRFQNPDGTLTAEGAKRYGTVKEMKKAVKDEYKKDNAMAKKLGNEAAIAAWAAKKQAISSAKAIQKYSKHPHNDKNKRHLEVEREVSRFLNENKRITQEKAEAHYKEMIKKYGKKAMKDIRYAKDGSIDERNSATGMNVLSGIAAGLTMVGMHMAGAPIAIAVAPVYSTNKEKGSRAQNMVRRQAYKLYDKEHNVNK